MSKTPETRFRDQPTLAMLQWIGRLFGADPIPGTFVPAVFLAVALTIIPTSLLFYGNRFTIAEPRPFVVALVSAAVISTLAVFLLSRKIAPHVAGGLVGAMGYGFFSLSWVPGSNRLPSLTFYWLLTATALALIVVWLLSNSKLILTVAGVVLSAGAAFLIGASLTVEAPTSAINSSLEIPEALAFAETPEYRPNVYIFVLDGFARPQITSEQFAEHGIDIDISTSLDELEDLGFQSDEHATANYGQTILSIPSTLNVEYHHTEEDPLSEKSIWAIGVPAIRGNNVLTHTLRSIGYEFWYASSATWSPSSCDPQLADRCIGESSNDAESMKAVWSATPLRWELGVPEIDALPSPQTIVDDILAARSTRETDDPYFAFAHIISPHQPYRYETDCSLRNNGDPGTELSDGHLPEFRELYADQASCLSANLVTAMDDLLNADPTALIFLQADHGSEFESARETADWHEEMAVERLGIFRATYLPDACRSDESAAQSVINTVPTIVNCITGTSPDFIEPNYFFTSFTNYEEIIEADESFADLVNSSN